MLAGRPSQSQTDAEQNEDGHNPTEDERSVAEDGRLMPQAAVSRNVAEWAAAGSVDTILS